MFIEGATYHVTSRTNNKIRVFDNKLGRKIMLLTLEEAKSKYGFCLYNFCIMPTHIHLLIRPAEGSNLSKILQWIKTHSAKRWNYIHGSKDHMWGDRFYPQIIKDIRQYFYTFEYISQNPVKAGLCKEPQDWKESGAYYIANDIHGLVDFLPTERLTYIKLLPPPTKQKSMRNIIYGA
jgi:putative transposase